MVRRRPPVILATDARRLSHPTDRGAFDWFVISILESPRFGADSEPPRSALCIVTSDAAQAHYVEVVHVARRGLGSPALRGSPRTRRSGRPLEVGEHEHVEKFGAHDACVQGRGRSGDLRDDLGLVEAHEAVLIRADLVHVDVVEPRDFEPADGLQVPLRSAPQTTVSATSSSVTSSTVASNCAGVGNSWLRLPPSAPEGQRRGRSAGVLLIGGQHQHTVTCPTGCAGTEPRSLGVAAVPVPTTLAEMRISVVSRASTLEEVLETRSAR